MAVAIALVAPIGAADPTSSAAANPPPFVNRTASIPTDAGAPIPASTPLPVLAGGLERASAQTARPRTPVAQSRPAELPVKASTGPAGRWRLDRNVSWYGPGFYGNRTACGLTLTKRLVGVAHRSLPCGTLVEFRDPGSDVRVVAPVVDRGPFVRGRTWDLTGGLCTKLDHCYTGSIKWRIVKRIGD